MWFNRKKYVTEEQLNNILLSSFFSIRNEIYGIKQEAKASIKQNNDLIGAVIESLQETMTKTQLSKEVDLGDRKVTIKDILDCLGSYTD